MNPFSRMKPKFAKRLTDQETQIFRIVVLTIAGFVVFLGITALIIFFVALRGEDRALVPDVRNMDLVAAIEELQTKDLIPFIQERPAIDEAARGTVMSQDPVAGTLVKAGREIILVVSAGPVLTTVSDYRGISLEQVTNDLQAANAGSAVPMLTIRQPIIYVNSGEPEGTVLDQEPEPGTPITQPMVLVLYVSQGQTVATVRLENFIGIEYRSAIQQLAELNIPFAFTLRAANTGETDGTIVEQSPAGGGTIPEQSLVRFTVTRPSATAPSVAGLFQINLQDFPIPVETTLRVAAPDGSTHVLFTMRHAGGPISVPYVELPGSVLTLVAAGEEQYRFVVPTPTEMETPATPSQ